VAEEASIPIVVVALASKGVLVVVVVVVRAAAEDIMGVKPEVMLQGSTAVVAEPHIVYPQAQLHLSHPGHMLELMELLEQQPVPLHQAHYR
jgi:hypothetical protein